MSAQIYAVKFNGARQSRRAASIGDIDARIEAVRVCSRWLVGNGVFVINVDLRVGLAGKPVIKVVASPLLRVLFGGDISSGQHWDEAAGRTAHDFKGVCHGCEVLWSEVWQ